MARKKTKKKTIILGVVFWTITALIGSIILTNVIDRNTNYRAPYFGLRVSVVVSSSMSRKHEDNTYLTDGMKQIQIKDAVITYVYRSFDDIQIYDVASYASSMGLITHRVIDKYEQDGTQYVVFRGDANNINDEPVPYEFVRGKVIAVMPKIGAVILYMQSWYFALALFFGLFFVFLGIYISKYHKGKKKQLAPAEETTHQGEVIDAEVKDASPSADTPTDTDSNETPKE